MRLLFLRHGDPNYETNHLLPNGKEEADLLAKRLKKEYPDIKDIYCSPYGRAIETMNPTLEILSKKGVIVDEFKEFPSLLLRPDRNGEPYTAWDWLPEDMNKHPLLYSSTNWMDDPIVKDSSFLKDYIATTNKLDEILEEHGYKRDGMNYKVINGNHDTIAIFCHYGVSSVMLSHLMNCSPYSLFQHTVLCCTSLTEFITEERRKGTASFRARQIGSIEHLLSNDVEIPFNARFVECFEDGGRHD